MLPLGNKRLSTSTLPYTYPGYYETKGALCDKGRPYLVFLLALINGAVELKLARDELAAEPS